MTTPESIWDLIRHAGPKGDSFSLSSLAEDWMHKYQTEYQRRRVFTQLYSWAVPTPEVIDKIKCFAGDSTILEVGAGRGLWAKLLKDAGASIIPTSERYPRGKFAQTAAGTFTRVRRFKAVDAVKRYREADVLLIIWPPYAEPMANEALKAFKGSRVIYIGESSGGCTGDESFHKRLGSWWDWDNEDSAKKRSKWEEVEALDIPQWDGIHDWVYFYRRKEK